MQRSLLYPIGEKTTNVFKIISMNNPTTTAKQMSIETYF